MNVLFVVAHPDDEVLGAGATINIFREVTMWLYVRLPIMLRQEPISLKRFIVTKILMSKTNKTEPLLAA